MHGHKTGADGCLRCMCSDDRVMYDDKLLSDG